MLDTGNTGFMLISAMLVLLMTPGLAFFYGGLSRRKNVVNTMMMSVMVIGVVAVIWVICGWSLAYGGDADNPNPFIGGFDLFGLGGMVQSMIAGGDISDGTGWPVLMNVTYQMAFAMITTAIITGSVAGRMKFGAIVTFCCIWVILIYCPLAHMVWGGGFIGATGVIGALDFAGGDVVHISSGLTGLVLCLILGKRKGYGVMDVRAHNTPFVLLGATLLWFGWFGFNGGSAFAANGQAALALLNTVVASGAASLSWMVCEKVAQGKSTLVGAATGLVAGLVVITPAAGYVEPWAAVVMGIIVSPICYLCISKLKHKLGYDDALDAFGCHCIGGITGGICTGLFCVPDLSAHLAADGTPYGGLLYTGDPTQFLAQLAGIGITIVFVIVGALVIGFIVKAIFHGSLRVSEEDEARGLDVTQHGESAYPAFLGMD